MKRVKFINWTLCFFFILSIRAQNTDLFVKTTKKGTAYIQEDLAVTKSYTALANTTLLLSQKTKKLSVLLPDGSKLFLIPKRSEAVTRSNTAWYGGVENDPGAIAIFSVTKNVVSGHIHTTKGIYLRITYLGNGVHQVAEIDPSKFKEKEIDYIKPETIGGPAVLPDCPDSPQNIDVMVVYTADAEAGAGGPEGMEALIYECIFRSNLAYENSNINQRLRLVHFTPVTYTETSNANTDLSTLQNNGDGVLDNVHTLRNTYAADLVVMLVENMTSYCGLGYYMDPISSGFADWAFSVVKRDCAAANLSFPHELGHNMGADHNCNGLESGIQHGHFVSSPADGSGLSWRTVMSYANCTSGPCTRIHNFSNPLVSYSPTASVLTNPTGTSGGVCSADNRSRLNASAATVANFRCSSPGVNNVWMKDTWQDTGLQPDPNTSGQDMWRSPYIWVRNTQDPTFLHQHEHQNPEFGSPNWVYVKLHNGSSSSQSGSLELYYANASVSLTWPGSWTLLGTTPATLTPNSTLVIERPWPSLPSTGHFCMVARWVSGTDPMAFVETSDINANTRNNNNIVWRNLNIVDLSADESMEVSMDVSNPSKYASQLVFAESTRFPTATLSGSGKIRITPDEALLKIWTRGKSKPKGFEFDGKSFVLTKTTASLDNLAIPHGFKGKLYIRFTKSDSTPYNEFDFSVKQYVFPPQAKKKIVGGVDYTIRNFYKKR